MARGSGNAVHNRTIYLSNSEDEVIWEKAKTLFPYALGMSVSKFIICKVRGEVQRLEKELHGTSPSQPKG